MRTGLLASFALGAMLTACASTDRDDDRDRGGGGDVLGEALGGILGGAFGRGITYRCDDDRRFVASFGSEDEEVTVDTGDRTYRLRLEDEDGDRREYEDRDGDVRLIVEDDEAELRIDGDEDFEDCEAR